jgi:hypothetical protein
MSSTVRIPWSRNYDNLYKWNEVCAWAIEMFGLPGDRFETHANVHYMDFIFKSNKDALMMAIQWNGQIVPDDTLTVEHVGSILNG